MTKNQYKIFEKIVKLEQKQLHNLMGSILKKRYETVKITNDYIYAIGDIPIGLVAHLDTVFTTPVVDLYYDNQKKVFWSPEGLGADDRAGVYAILDIIQSGLRPHIILTTDEEKGCIGAGILSKEKNPFPELKYLIQLDRRNTNDCVFYDCNTKDFIKYIESFGFIEAYGTFSDISMLCPAWEVCGVNLSVGYQNEHTRYENLNIKALEDTIKKVKNMLNAKDIPTFEYEEEPYANWYNSTYYPWAYPSDDDGIHCSRCKKLVSEYEVIPVRTEDKKTVYYCIDCISSPKVGWCKSCSEAFLTEKNQDYCKICREGLLV